MLKLFAISGLVGLFGLMANKCTVNTEVLPTLLGF